MNGIQVAPDQEGEMPACSFSFTDSTNEGKGPSLLTRVVLGGGGGGPETIFTPSPPNLFLKTFFFFCCFKRMGSIVALAWAPKISVGSCPGSSKGVTVEGGSRRVGVYFYLWGNVITTNQNMGGRGWGGPCSMEEFLGKEVNGRGVSS